MAESTYHHQKTTRIAFAARLAGIGRRVAPAPVDWLGRPRLFSACRVQLRACLR